MHFADGTLPQRHDHVIPQHVIFATFLFDGTTFLIDHPTNCSADAKGGGMSIERIGGARTGTGGQHLPFCQATIANGFVFVSGQVALGDDGEVIAGGVVPQTHHCIQSIVAILEKAGCTLKDVVKANVWLDDTRDFQAFNRVYASYFGEALPARACVQSALMVDAKVEIEVIALQPRR
jgi:reactive intermediate/imine deaminase